MIYLLDTNVISDLIANQKNIWQHFDRVLEAGDSVDLCQPVLYELRRGFFWKRSSAKDRTFNQKILPRLTLITLTDDDWLQAAQFWAESVSRGKQLSDIDLLLAALTNRLDATLVTADDDFDALPIQRVNWRIS